MRRIRRTARNRRAGLTAMGNGDDEARKAQLGSRAEWHPDTVCRLIDGYGEKCANIKGYLKTKDWEEIVKYVNIQCEGSKPKTMQRCREKIDSLKRRYKLEKKRAEMRGSNHVEWSFFHQLDQIMRNLKRSGSGSLSEGQSSEEVAGALDCQGSAPDGFDGDNRSDLAVSKFSDKGKACAESPEEVLLLEDGLNGDADRCNNRRTRSEGGKGKKALGVSDRISKKSICKSSNPVQALADALVGFSDIYSRIEIAKMELFTKMNIELAKLHQKEKKNPHPSSSTLDCADSEKCRMSE